MGGLLVSLWLAMEVQGAGQCPAPAEVEAKLAPLLPPDFASSSGDQAVIVEGGDGSLSVSLARPDGLLIGQRRLPRAATCSEQAETVAVTLAVWEAQIHPEISLRLDRLATAPAAPTVPPPMNPDVVIARPVPAVPPAATAWALGAAAVGSWQPGSVAPGARLDAMLGKERRPWRARLSGVGVGKHATSLDPGQAQWWRLYVALGADYVLPVGRWWDVAFGAAGVAGITTIEGSRFAINHTARAFDVGAEAMLRADVRLGAVRPWLGVGLVTWLRRQVVSVTGLSMSGELPRLEPMLALGADFCW